MTTTTATAAPPTEGPLAYLKTITGGGITVSALVASALGGIGTDQLEALAVALISDGATYAFGNSPTGWRRYTKGIVNWAGTIIAAVPLALSRYEGDHGLLVTGLDAHDWSTILLLAAKSALVTVVPNVRAAAKAAAAQASTGDIAGAAATALHGLEHAVLDIPAPVEADGSGEEIAPQRVETSMLPVITPEMIAQAQAAPVATEAAQ